MKIITQRQIESIKDKIGSRRFYYILSNTVDALRENELKSVIVEEQRGFYLIVGQFQSYRQFQCSVALHKDGILAKYYCHCYNSYDVICEHSLALLLCAATNDIQKFPAQLDAQFIFSAVKKLVKSIPQYYCNMNPFYNLFLTQEDMEFYETIAQSETFMQKQDSFLNHLFAPISKEKVHLEVSSSTNEDGKEYFRLKIGNHKMYVVKNVSQFLEAFFDEKTISYGKDLTFSHSIDYLDDESLELLNLLKAGIFFKDHTMRDFAFGGASLDRFFQLCKSFGETHCTFRCVQERGFLALNICKEADYYRISIHHQDSNLSNVQVTPKAIYQSNQNVLTQKFFDEHGVVVSFIKQLLHQDLLLDEQNFQKFYALMIEPYKPYLQLNIEGFDLNQSIDESITLYVDLNDSYLVEYRIGYELNGMHLPLSEALKQSQRLAFIWNLIKKSAQSSDDECLYMEPKNQTTNSFVKEVLPMFNQYCDVMISESVQNLTKPTYLSLQAGVKVKGNLLEVDLSSVHFKKDEIADILKAYRRRKKFHRLKDGTVIDLEGGDVEEANTLLEDLNIDLNDVKKGKVKMPLSRAYQLEEPSSSTIELYYDKSYQTLMEKLKEPNPAYQIHPRFDTILRDYQKDGVKWLLKLHQYRLSGILADDMGLGKSIQVIALLESVKLDKPSILVVPASLIYNWQEETKKFETTLSVLCIKGSRAARKEQIQKINQYDLIITSYDYLKRDLEDYEQIEFAYVILDEAQYIKNLKTQNAHSVKHLQSEYRLALSGTPIENTLAELWSVFDFLMPGYLYPYARFNKEYEKQIVRRQDEYKIKRLKQMVSPFILRRTKKEVLAELPEKTEVNIYVPFEKEEERLYLANLAKINENLAELFEQEHVSQIQILAMMTRLRQLCCEPRVVYDNIHRLFSKLKETIALCHKLKQNGQKILLFSNFTKILELIEKELAVNQFSYLKLTGSNTKEQRAKMVQVFQEGNTDIFLISLKAGGTGLNLTKASAVIHYDPWWNLSAQNQASDRAHRIGQESKVTVYKMIMENSIEEKIAQLQLRKQELADLFIEGSEFSLSQMSEDEIYSLFQRKQ